MQKIIFSLGVWVTALNASAISYHAEVTGTSAPLGSRFTADGGNLDIKQHNGFFGLGISGGPSGGEIDLSQRLSIHFDQPQILRDLTLAFLYDGPEYNDGNELAALRLNGVEYVLTATGPASFLWTGAGQVQNISPALLTGGGIWKIVNPFGEVPLHSIDLYPLPYPQGRAASNPSDFSLQAFTTSAVPEAGATLVLLGMGAAALAVLQKRSQPRRSEVSATQTSNRAAWG